MAKKTMRQLMAEAYRGGLRRGEYPYIPQEKTASQVYVSKKQATEKLKTLYQRTVRQIRKLYKSKTKIAGKTILRAMKEATDDYLYERNQITLFYKALAKEKKRRARY